MINQKNYKGINEISIKKTKIFKKGESYFILFKL